MGFTGDGTSDGIRNTNTESTALNAVAHGEDGVGCLSGLGDEDTHIVTEDRCLAVQKVTGQLGGNGDLGELLKDSPSLEREWERKQAIVSHGPANKLPPIHVAAQIGIGIELTARALW
jgi:hypothetical protein